MLLIALFGFIAYTAVGCAYISAWNYTPERMTAQLCEEDAELSGVLRELPHAKTIMRIVWGFYALWWPLLMVEDIFAGVKHLAGKGDGK